jgi:ribosomal-protein-alanine N-acetyltransferase
MNAEWQVREAGQGDLPAIIALASACHGAPAWSEAMWARVLRDAARVTFVAEQDGVLLGFVVASYIVVGSEIESVAVRSEARGRGLGRQLCGRAMAWAREQGADEMHLEVRASNMAALRLYRALGFVEQGRRRGYYRDPAEDAVLMSAPLDSRTGCV